MLTIVPSLRSLRDGGVLGIPPALQESTRFSAEYRMAWVRYEPCLGLQHPRVRLVTLMRAHTAPPRSRPPPPVTSGRLPLVPKHLTALPPYPQ